MTEGQRLLTSPLETYTAFEWNRWIRRANAVFLAYRHGPPDSWPRYVDALWEKAWNESQRRGEQLVLFT